MKFRTKIWMMPVSAATVFVVGCAISYMVGAHTSAALERLRLRDYPAMEAVGKIERHGENFRSALQTAAIEGDESKLKDVEALGVTTLEAIKVLSGIGEQDALADALRDGTAAYQTSALEATRAMLAKKEPGDLITQMQARMVSLDKLVSSSKGRTSEAVAQSQDAVAAGVKRGLLVVLGTCLAALAALGMSSKVIIASVWRDLGDEPAQLGDSMPVSVNIDDAWRMKFLCGLTLLVTRVETDVIRLAPSADLSAPAAGVGFPGGLVDRAPLP